MRNRGLAILGITSWLFCLTIMAKTESPVLIWHVSAGIDYAYHQYYDVPAWNCDGSILLLRGINSRVYLAQKTGQAPVELKLPELPQRYLQWDQTKPQILYYITYRKPQQTLLYSYNLTTNTAALLIRIDDRLDLAPAHPDGEHLLLTPRINDQSAAVIYSLTTGKTIKIPVPTKIHRVRFTTDQNLSLFCNNEKESVSAERTNWLLDAKSGRSTLIGTGFASHPDWQLGGQMLSYFEQGNLVILDQSGQEIRRIPGINGHQSWSRDGRYIVADIYQDKKKSYGGMIVLVEVATGKIIPIIEHRSKLEKDQATHPHARFSPDGTKIVYNSNNFGSTNPQVYVVDISRVIH